MRRKNQKAVPKIVAKPVQNPQTSWEKYEEAQRINGRRRPDMDAAWTPKPKIFSLWKWLKKRFVADPFLEDRKRLVELEVSNRARIRNTCLHRRTNCDGSYQEKLNIKWMFCSDGVYRGVCGTCFSSFDSRNLDDKALLLADKYARENAGRALQLPINLPIKKSLWRRIKDAVIRFFRP